MGAVRLVSGVVDSYGDEMQMTHPDHVAATEDAASIPGFEPVYSLTAGLTGKVLRRLIAAALARTPDLPEWHDPALVTRRGWPAWRDALATAHAPADAAAVIGLARAEPPCL